MKVHPTVQCTVGLLPKSIIHRADMNMRNFVRPAVMLMRRAIESKVVTDTDFEAGYRVFIRPNIRFLTDWTFGYLAG